MHPDFEYLEWKYKFSRDILEFFWGKYGPRTEKIIEALKRPCAKYTIRINLLKTTARTVQKMLFDLNIQAELHPTLEEVVYLPVQGPNSISVYEKVIVVDKFAAESLLQGADLFAPGVVKTSKIRVGDQVTIIDKSGAIIAAGIAQMTAKEILQLRKGLAVKVIDSLYKVCSVRESTIFKQGYVVDQSFPSILASRILDPQPKESVIDMCAAPGGKATHIAQLMQNSGQVLAVDRSKPKIESLNEHIRRLGIKNILTLAGDSRTLPDTYYQWADKVLIDPPCTALGVRPKLYDTTTKKDIKDAASYQRHFLKSAIQYVKPKGILVYCTCTLTTEENEENIKYLIDNFNCEIVEQPLYFGSPGEPIADLPNYEKLQRFYPDEHETPGYFIAKIKMLS